MKKYLIIALALIAMQQCFANDSALLVSRMQAVQNRPEGLSENRAVHLILHPLAVDTAITYREIISRGIFFPFSGTLTQRKKLTPVYYDGAQWSQEKSIYLIDTDAANIAGLNTAFSWSIIVCFAVLVLLSLLNLFSFNVEVKNNIKEREYGWAKSEIHRYRRESRYTASKEFWTMLILIGMISFEHFLAPYTILSTEIYLMFFGWIIIATTCAYAVRKAIVSASIKRVERRYASSLVLA